jgi:hypothetical protein
MREKIILKLDSQKAVIEKLLKEDERCRNDDKWLTYRFFQHYTKIYIPFSDFKKIPAFANAQKIRQVIQNKNNKYLPTNPEVRYERGISEDEWRSWLKKQ